jgi:hypothetical protein
MADWRRRAVVAVAMYLIKIFGKQRLQCGILNVSKDYGAASLVTEFSLRLKLGSIGETSNKCSKAW